MLLYVNRNSVGIGQIHRYEITYTPSRDDKCPKDQIHIKVKNEEVLAMRGMYLNGPFILYVDVKTPHYNHNKKTKHSYDEPLYEPQIKAGQSFHAQLRTSGKEESYTWIIDVVSQVIFSPTAEVAFTIIVGTDKESLDSISTSNIIDGLHSSTLNVTHTDTFDIWNTPKPSINDDVHLVILSHGLYSNTGADMLYLKEQIDKTIRSLPSSSPFKENVIVRGYFGNAGRTERGIKYLGKRLANYVAQSSRIPNLKKISFIGHSLGGLVMTYAIAYIHTHYPDFFKHVKPINFITLATPLLGLNGENPGYVKLGLEIGVVGKSGQDLGLSWLSHFTSPQKPLLKILPNGPAREILKQFERRTIYANAINDGIVPLRTSSLFFLDWKALSDASKVRSMDKNDSNDLPANESHSSQLASSSSLSSSSPSSSASPASSASSSSSSSSSSSAHPFKSPSKSKFPTLISLAGSPVHKSDNSENPNDLYNSSEVNEETDKNPQLKHSGKTSASIPKDQKLEQTGYKSSWSTILNPLHAVLTGLLNPQGGKKQKTIKHSQTLLNEGDDESNGINLTKSEENRIPPKASVIESASSLLNPPLPPPEFINDPAFRPNSIFHDRIYYPVDIPPVALKRAHPLSPKLGTWTEDAHTEEKIARSWHKDMAWRKVLVELKPDAHNNIIVRRQFANAYGWPVIDHLVEHHFKKPYEFDPARSNGTSDPYITKRCASHESSKSFENKDSEAKLVTKDHDSRINSPTSTTTVSTMWSTSDNTVSNVSITD